MNNPVATTIKICETKPLNLAVVLKRRREEPAVDRGPDIMSRRGCIGDAGQVRRPAVNPKERARSVENPTFDALCGLVRRPTVTPCHHLIYVNWYNCAD